MDRGAWWSVVHGRSPGAEWQPTPLFFPRKSHGQRSLVVCSPWGRKESETAGLAAKQQRV